MSRHINSIFSASHYGSFIFHFRRQQNNESIFQINEPLITGGSGCCTTRRRRNYCQRLDTQHTNSHRNEFAGRTEQSVYLHVQLLRRDISRIELQSRKLSVYAPFTATSGDTNEAHQQGTLYYGDQTTCFHMTYISSTKHLFRLS